MSINLNKKLLELRTGARSFINTTKHCISMVYITRAVMYTAKKLRSEVTDDILLNPLLKHLKIKKVKIRKGEKKTRR